MASTTKSGDELQFLENGRQIGTVRLWTIRILMFVLFIGGVQAALSTRSGASYVAGVAVGIGAVYWLALKIASSDGSDA